MALQGLAKSQPGKEKSDYKCAMQRKQRRMPVNAIAKSKWIKFTFVQLRQHERMIRKINEWGKVNEVNYLSFIFFSLILFF
jgi:hypothetical protein